MWGTDRGKIQDGFRDKGTRWVPGAETVEPDGFRDMSKCFWTKIPDGFGDKYTRWVSGQGIFRESLRKPLRESLGNPLRKSFRESLKDFLKGFGTGRSVSGQRYQMGFGTGNI